MRVAEQLADHQAAARLQHAGDLAQRGVRVGDLAEHGDQEGGVEGVVLVGHRGRVGLGRDDVRQAALAGAPDRVVEHLLLQVEDFDLAVGPHPLGDVERVVAGARADLQDPLARPSGRGSRAGARG